MVMNDILNGMSIPLAEQLRPSTFDEVYGQEKIVLLLKKITDKKNPLSILLWGPPGCGKTTIARLYAKAFHRPFLPFSAVESGVQEIKKAIQEAKSFPLTHGRPILFVDEIHRLNKAQQDIFLPAIEDGSVILVGATTENPSFTLNNALLSRFRVLTLESLSKEALFKIILRFEKNSPSLQLSDDAKSRLINLSHGDGRYLLNTLENLQTVDDGEVDQDTLSFASQNKAANYDRHSDGHFNLISALHKSVRGSDPDAALYYFSRMIEGGEDPNYLARRLLRMATEDIGLADPSALNHALTAWQTFERLGPPEGILALAQLVLYLALAPKSNAVYMAYKKASESAQKTSHLDPPKTILNASTGVMKKEGYGKGYQYDHDTLDGFSGQDYFPEEISREQYYFPVKRGFEREMEKRYVFFEKLRERLHSS